MNVCSLKHCSARNLFFKSPIKFINLNKSIYFKGYEYIWVNYRLLCISLENVPSYKNVMSTAYLFQQINIKTIRSTELLVHFYASQKHLLWFSVLLFHVLLFWNIIIFVYFYLLSSVCHSNARDHEYKTCSTFNCLSHGVVLVVLRWMSFYLACVILFCRFHPVDVKSNSLDDVPLCRPHPIQGWNLTILWEKWDEGFQSAGFGIMAVGEWDVRSGT